ncbi:leucine rich repeat (LRR) protein [Maribacter vaceletii]|uniref:non-specific serine/threonine protein kinase n=1 Tax=Maribacter vaceletii TaxID=1206816 RepID=A0A495E5L6_9FLAO|nr:COR domain-containing protein [Maribacter vaceletii]RKR12218.1 leucine rich repeat (LRR) protein [Maribacter vaceletii]
MKVNNPIFFENRRKHHEYVDQKINSIRSDKSGFINLSSLELIEVPEILREVEDKFCLDLSSNSLSDLPDWFYDLDNILFLNLRGNNFSQFPVRLLNMKSIIKIDFSFNNLGKLKFWESDNSNLEILVLDNCRLIKFPRFIKGLKKLVNLSINNNFLRKVPDWINELTNIKTLNCENNYLRNIPNIKNLNNLECLNLKKNKIVNITDDLTRRQNLEQLGLSSNKIKEYPQKLNKLRKLRRLELENNNLKVIPEFIKDLKTIEVLNISNNSISTLKPLNNLKNLKNLNFSSCNVISLEPILHILEKGTQINESPTFVNPFISSIYLKNNKLEYPPIEIIKQGNSAILRYFKRLNNTTQKAVLNEAKVLIVGRTGAGKTSLRYKLRNEKSKLPKSDESTQGIDVEILSLKLDNNNSIKLNIWDFEGQSIAYQTHQFFLSKRSLYLFVVDTRTEKTDTDYWFQIIEILGGGSPLILFNNEKQGKIAHLNHKALIERFGSFLVDQVYQIDLRKISEDKTETQKFHRFIFNTINQIKSLPLVGIKLEKSWLKVREKIQKISKSKSVISAKELFDICDENGITEKQDKLDLSQLFHDLGVFLHFQDFNSISILNNIIILRNEWSTKAVYRILKSESIKKEKGKFMLKDIQNIFNTDDNLHKDYEAEILELMVKFKLCYKVINTDYFIIPQLLEPNKISGEVFDYSETTQLKVIYDFMPKGIMTLLIIELHPFIAKNQTTVWRDGLVIEYLNSVAEIEESQGIREILIKSKGPKRNLIALKVLFAIDTINSRYNFTSKSSVKTKLQCTCKECIDNENPYFFDLLALEKYREKGGKEFPCGNTGNVASINKILSILENGEQNNNLELNLFKEANQITPEKITFDIIEVSSRVLERKFVKRIEDQINDDIVDLLRTKGYNVTDQTRSGASESGLKSGELDLMLRRKNGIPLTIIESLRLKSCGSKNRIIAAHINKLFTKYDTHGLERNFMLVFAETKNFQNLCRNYFRYIDKLNSKIGFDKKEFPITRLDKKSDLSKSANIKIAISYHLHNNETRELAHIILNMR